MDRQQRSSILEAIVAAQDRIDEAKELMAKAIALAERAQEKTEDAQKAIEEISRQVNL